MGVPLLDFSVFLEWQQGEVLCDQRHLVDSELQLPRAACGHRTGRKRSEASWLLPGPRAARASAGPERVDRSLRINPPALTHPLR